jgi:transcription elongation factor Elf1
LIPGDPVTIIRHALLTGLNATEEDRMGKKTQKVEVCKCHNCGNEGEMTVTCELMDVPVAEKKKAAKPVKQREKKSFTCTKCGNESEMVVDL